MCEYECECIFCMCKCNLFFVILFCKIEFCMCKCICICMCKAFSFGATPGYYSAMVCGRRDRGWSGGWQQLELFYEDLFLYGPGFGYFPHPAKYKVMRWRMILCWYLYKCVRRNAKIKSTTKNTPPPQNRTACCSHPLLSLLWLYRYCTNINEVLNTVFQGILYHVIEKFSGGYISQIIDNHLQYRSSFLTESNPEQFCSKWSTGNNHTPIDSIWY